MFEHISVLEEEIIHFFKPLRLIHFCDATLGLGGHTLRLLQEHPEAEKWLGIDQDKEALAIAKKRLQRFHAKMTFIHSNFSDLVLEENLYDGILADLGLSSLQLDQQERGFSFMREGPLDMRMDQDNPLSAKTIINEWSEEDLISILKKYGEEPQAKKIARLIVLERKKRPISTTEELCSFLLPHLPQKKRSHHPLTLTFQALRIAVNSELQALSQFLPKALSALKPGGRLAIISFHSLEDRIVKEFFREEASDKVSSKGLGGLFLDKKPSLRILTRKPMVPSDEESRQNPRARSAKLRVSEKIGELT
jgi:16S rRNA (cytosine1402-N4)-methyltransferase